MANLSDKILPSTVTAAVSNANSAVQPGDASITLATNSIQQMTNWTITQSGTNLIFSYDGTARFKLTSAGALTVEDNVTAYGNA